MLKTIKQCMELTGLPYSAIRGLCLQNKVKYIRSGNRYYINVQSLLSYCNEGGEPA